MARGGDGGGGGGGEDSKGGTGAEDVVCADGRCEWSAIEPAGRFGSISCQIRTHDKRATARRTSGTRPVGGRGICSSSKPSGHPFTAVVLNSNLIRATELRAYKGLGAYQQPQDCSSVDPLEQTSPSFLPLPIIVRCMAALCCTLALEGEYYLAILPVFLVQHTHVREESAARFCR